MIREKEKNNKEGRLWRLKKFEEESYREAVSSIHLVSAKISFSVIVGSFSIYVTSYILNSNYNILISTITILNILKTGNK